MTTPTTPTPTTPTLAELEAQRAKLALAAAEGRKGAVLALAGVEKQIEALKLAEERAQAAAVAREARDREQAAEEETRRRAAIEAELVRLTAQLEPLARGVDRTVEALVQAVAALVAVADQMQQLSGAHRPRQRLAAAIAGSVGWRLGSVVEIARVDKFYRRPLEQILRGDEGPPPDAPPSRPVAEA
jgi:hypothetical protein